MPEQEKQPEQKDKFYTGVKSEKETEPVIEPQTGRSHDIARRVFQRFDIFHNNRNQSFTHFRNRALLEYTNDNNQRFNNYRQKPEWKEDWQSNISDITTHAKLMAIVAQILVNTPDIRAYPRFSRDIFSQIKANLLQNIYLYTDTVERNGEIDELFTLIRAAREGTVIAFEGYKKTKLSEGIDFQFVGLDDFYPGDITKYHMQDQTESVWRSVMNWNDFVDRYKSKKWKDVNLVKPAGQIRSVEEPYFDISTDLDVDEVEIIRYFNVLEDEFHILANGVLISHPNSKFSDRFKLEKLPFAKTVYEPYSDQFFWGRALPDIMKDNQDAIDFLFNAMFDKEILSVMRPILVGGVNDLTEKFWFPGGQANVMDVTQVKEMGFEGPDMQSFRMLKELKDNQTFATSVGAGQQGIATGRKTATEVERTTEAAKRIFALFSTLINDFRLQKARLRMSTIQRFYIKNDKFEPFIIDSTKLINGGMGTLSVKVTGQPAPSDMFGFSSQLRAKNAMIEGQSVLFEIDEEQLRDLEVILRLATDDKEITGALRKGFDREFAGVALTRPDLFHQIPTARNFAKAMYQDPDEVVINQPQQSRELGTGQMPGSELANELVPTQQAAMPSLKSLITAPLSP